MKNLVKPFLDEREITPYRFWHDTGISRVTAYKLYNDSSYIPGADVLIAICDTYKIQPGVILRWIEGGEKPAIAEKETKIEQEGKVTTRRKRSKSGQPKSPRSTQLLKVS